MRWLLTLLIAFLTLSSVFAWDPGPAPGVNIKNAILYLLAMGLFARTAMQRRFDLQLRGIHIAFVILIGYAIFSYLAIVLFIDYPRYNELRAAFDLKNRAVDQMLFFLVFFYGTQSRQDAMGLIKALIAAWILSHAVAILDAAGVVQFGDIERRDDGRVQGTVGESNQYGAFVALTLPAVIAAAFSSRGLMRWLWSAAALLTLGTLLMTVSRGAFVGVLFAAALGAWLFRRYLSPTRMAALAGSTLLALMVVGLVVGIWYGNLIHERLVAGMSSDMGGTSSGRTEIWSAALETMWEHPVSFLTGFGWNAYWAMPFRYSPHNYYLAQWFNLGLPGLICSVLLIVLPIRAAWRAAFAAPAEERIVLTGFVIAAIAFAAATFFVDLYEPWNYFWAYAGLVMRIAMLQQPAHRVVDPPVAPTAITTRRDAFGWAGAARS